MVHAVAVPSRRPAVVVAALLAALVLGFGACSNDGRELAPVEPGQTSTSQAPPALGVGPADVFSLRSSAFEDGGVIPEQFTCTGDGISPALEFKGVPSGAELALVVRDRDAQGFVHWIVTGIDPATGGFLEGGIPEGAVEQANTTGAIGYLPPCPPAGSGRHIYDFVLHVLDAPLQIDPALPADEVARLIEDASIPEAPLAGTVAAGG